jgi:hypothetical protein
MTCSGAVWETAAQSSCGFFGFRNARMHESKRALALPNSTYFLSNILLFRLKSPTRICSAVPLGSDVHLSTYHFSVTWDGGGLTSATT